MGGSNENSSFGPVLNSENTEYVPGGSSGGSAVAVKAGLCTVSLGSDTGGSIRQPASFTGTVGFKPTYGAISRYGLIAYASSFDQIGVFSNFVCDAATIYNVMNGPDKYDSTAIQSYNKIPLAELKNETKFKIGVISDYLHAEGLDKEVKESIQKALEVLEKNGNTIIEASFPFLDVMVPTYYVLTTAEASSNLSRFDGVHYGHRSNSAEGVEQTYIKSRSEGFGKEVKRRIMAGTFVLSQGYYDAYFTKLKR